MASDLARPAAPDMDAQEYARALSEAWRKIDGVLTPIIGKRGLAALQVRSVHLAAKDHPWLLQLPSAGHDAIDLTALEAAVARQDGPAAAGARDVVLVTFHTLLVSLIGASLAERLIGPAPPLPPSGSSAQESST